MPYIAEYISLNTLFCKRKIYFLPFKGKFDANQNWTDWKYKALEQMEV